ncbi:sarcosine oxidase subunit gamma family protein [Maritimibacter sp. UBA3975]|uniref:sarcosine oxidase subunit gamma n=1 Tax=Maritimibacter sp. UBA3975 TaxID=1946833 RepID=UPI000C0952F8|nr:sarcosine oxidase subunit gamma family protein [Maritimibacter sp. UBA3975]MAM61142.1 sarcosine oxidase subunit gamma [Maritimibacter sp.]|tara:strand:- start:9208 stop:9756 length:549 start_codon:yes stop_codon:yes gene_type:complete
MSKAVSALNGATVTGFARVTDTGCRGMITLRGAPEVLTRVATAIGLPTPDTLHMATKEGLAVGWMSPDELLVLCPYEDAPALAETARGAAGKDHALVAVVSDARAVIRVEGEKADEVLRKLTPANLDAFEPGMIRRTRLAQAAGAFWKPDANGFEVMCFRSEAEYVFGLLENAAQKGAELGL